MAASGYLGSRYWAPKDAGRAERWRRDSRREDVRAGSPSRGRSTLATYGQRPVIALERAPRTTAWGCLVADAPERHYGPQVPLTRSASIGRTECPVRADRAAGSGARSRPTTGTHAHGRECAISAALSAGRLRPSPEYLPHGDGRDDGQQAGEEGDPPLSETLSEQGDTGVRQHEQSTDGE